jgi:CheY-like chemotaxis protein
MNSLSLDGTSQRHSIDAAVLNEAGDPAKIAHDLRNALTAILGTVGLLRETHGLPSDIAFGLAAVEKAAVHARNLSLQLGSPSPSGQVEAPKPPQEPARTSQSSSSTLRILAMDDEPGIRALLSAALGHFGYDTVTVADGADAIREYQRALNERQPFAAVIMDLTVPGGMGGKEAIKALKQIDPNVKAIVSSGCSTDPAATEFASHGFVARADKPYRIQELGAIIQSTLRN